MMLRSVFADPVFLTCALALIGVVLVLASGRRRSGVALIVVALASLYALSTDVVSSRLLALAEGEPHPWPTPLPQENDAPQAIVVLSGGTARQPPEFGGDTVAQDTLERLLYTARLYRATGLPVLVSGGVLHGATRSIASAMAETLRRDFAVPVAWEEARSTTTYENARYSYAILAPLGIRRIYLVTSAAHMPRARAIFEEAGFAVTPMPTIFTFAVARPRASRCCPPQLLSGRVGPRPARTCRPGRLPSDVRGGLLTARPAAFRLVRRGSGGDNADRPRPGEVPMRVGDQTMRTIRRAADGRAVEIIDQTRLPHALVVARLHTVEDAAHAIRTMQVRGAPLIGVTAAYGLALAACADASDAALAHAHDLLLATRPTAVNLRWALEDMGMLLAQLPPERRAEAAWRRAGEMADDDVALNSALGDHGLTLIEAALAAKGGKGVVHVLTHCNAGWLAAVDWGTALAPVYKAHRAGLPVHVFADETRPRNQGAALTAWELGGEGVPHTVVVDNAGGHLMQRGLVDLCIVGTDRTTRTGDVCNKIGTYLKALAARDNGVPFFVAAPGPSIDWSLRDGKDIPIETRAPAEVTSISGITDDGRLETVRLTPAASPARNDAFDVTPAHLVSGLITERGICQASERGLLRLFPERR